MFGRPHPLVVPDWLPTSFEDFRELIIEIILEWAIAGLLQAMFHVVEGIYRVVVAFFELLVIVLQELRNVGALFLDILLSAVAGYESTLVLAGGWDGDLGSDPSDRRDHGDGVRPCGGVFDPSTGDSMNTLRDLPLIGTMVGAAGDLLLLSGYLTSVLISSTGEIFTLLAISSAYRSQRSDFCRRTCCRD